MEVSGNREQRRLGFQDPIRQRFGFATISVVKNLHQSILHNLPERDGLD
jgi:hypothetical protein